MAWSDKAVEAANRIYCEIVGRDTAHSTKAIRAALNAAAAVDGKRARSSYADDAAYNQLLKGKVCPEDQPFVADWIKRLSEQTDGDAQWNAAIDKMPEDGREILVMYGHQGGVVSIANFSRLYKCWMSKGKPCPGLQHNATHWAEIPDKTAAILSLKRP